METTLVWTVLLPFIGASVLGATSLVKWRDASRWAGQIASGFVLLSFFHAVRLAYAHLTGGVPSATVADFGSWMTAGTLTVRAALFVDVLSVVLVLVITGVGFLIHVYSIGYMSHDPGRGRYFAYLNLFCGFMLVLVTGTSLPILFIGWEGVGLCSYLLIGFWFSDRTNSRAARKAFVVNRIGDAGFLIAMFLIYQLFNTLTFSEMAASTMSQTLKGSWALEWIAIFLFVGCIGKSAQFPLYIWLPDAMAGPTPVSALIHAATMVTAGVYLLARMSFLYELTPFASELVAGVGAFTALFAASIATTQRDIKKILAFSTVSQLGFMVLAMGIGAYSAGVFHLVTHAYFKALLFLGAGSVIHALKGEQNVLQMGGLKNYIVGTTVVFGAGYLAIIGIPPFSGWWSKDQILYHAYLSGETHLFVLAVLAALLTTFYMTRLFCLVFIGTPRLSKQKIRDVHESPLSMLAPMGVLAVLAFFGGFFPLSVEPALKAVLPGAHKGAHGAGLSEGKFAFYLTLAVVFVSVATFYMYTAWKKKLENIALRCSNASLILERQYRYDDALVWLASRGSSGLAEVLRWFDVYVIDGLVNGVGGASRSFGTWIGRLQNGLAQSYAFFIVVGSIVMVVLLLRNLS